MSDEMSRDKQTEIHELAKQMSEAISTAVEERYIEDEAKLRAVLIESGWRKASEVAEEIFDDLEKYGEYDSGMYHFVIGAYTYQTIRKKYTEDGNEPKSVQR